MAEVKARKTAIRVREDIKHRIMPYLWERNLKLKDLAEKTGMRYDMLCDKVNGSRPFNSEELERISDVLGISIYIGKSDNIIIKIKTDNAGRGTKR